MKLLREEVNDIRYLAEDAGDGTKRLYIEGIFAQAEIVNKNKRRYPLPVLEKEVLRYMKEEIKNRTALGELSHPKTPEINPERACILIENMKRDDNNFIGRAKVLSNDCGKCVSALINDGVRLGVSTRALGSIKALKEGVNEVQDDFRLITVDVVSNPSAPDAYVDAIMEGREWVFDAASGTWVESLVDTHKKIVESSSLAKIEETKAALWESFFEALVHNEYKSAQPTAPQLKDYVSLFLRK